MLCIKYKIDAEKVRGARVGFPHPGTNQKVTLGAKQPLPHPKKDKLGYEQNGSDSRQGLGRGEVSLLEFGYCEFTKRLHFEAEQNRMDGTFP